MKFTYASGSKPLAGYTLKRGVGVGGFGEVYFALSDAGKEVALKRVQRNLDVELRGVSHCLNLKHPNLISLYDIRYDDSGQAWVVMEYVAGESLRATLDRAPVGLSDAEARRWFAGIAAGVAHLHDAGIVHRDLKPGNIFDDGGIVKIGDYGLSKYISTSRRGGHTESVGTFHYMAPEVGRGSYGREIDVYAMGIILFELLTGTVPFDGESSHEIVMKHLTANPDLSGIAEPYRAVIWQALQKNPTARQQTVAQMVRPLGIELDEYGMARVVQSAATQPVIAQPVMARVVGASAEPGIHFVDPSEQAFSSDAAGGHRGASGAVEAPEVRFGEVRYHRPSPVPLAGAVPASPVAMAAAMPRGGAPEPLARAVRSTASDMGRWWSSLEPFPGTRIILLLLAAILVIVNTEWLLPLLAVLAILYVPYYVVRSMMLGVTHQPTYLQAHQAALSRRQQPRPMTARQWRQRRRGELAARPAGERVVELGGALSSAPLCAAMLAGIAATIGLWEQSWNSAAVAPYAWLAVVATVAAMVVMALGKLWEREEGPTLPRRVVMLGAGAAVGAAAFAMATYLMLPIDQGLQRDVQMTDLPVSLYDSSGAPTLGAYMGYFALLMAGLRWWRVADPLRRRRLSLWSVAVAVVFAWAVHQVLPVPQPWGMVVAGLTALAIQITAPWENPKERFRDAQAHQPQNA